MLDIIKRSLRITGDTLDAEIQEQIAAAKAELARVGIVYKDTPLHTQAVKLYIKWQYNFEGEADRYHRAFELLEQALILSGDD